MFWHAILGFFFPLVIVILYAGMTSTTFFKYENMGYFWIFLGACSDLMACTFNVLAFQNDKSSFISLLAYTGVVYAFAFDFFIFKTSMTVLQLIFALAIMCTTVVMAIFKYKVAETKSKEEGFDISNDISVNTSF